MVSQLPFLRMLWKETYPVPYHDEMQALLVSGPDHKEQNDKDERRHWTCFFRHSSPKKIS